MKKLLVVVALVAVGAVSTAQAQETGLSISGRVGYAFPMGDAGDNIAMDDLLDGNIPLGLEVGYRFARALEIGGYLEYGFGRESSALSNAGVDVSSLRIGAELNYLLAPEANLVPWIGVGAGWTRLKADLGPGDDSISGYDFTVQGGAQWKLAPQFSVGPYASLTFGRYTDSDITEKAWHEWLQVGLRGTFAF